MNRKKRLALPRKNRWCPACESTLFWAQGAYVDAIGSMFCPRKPPDKLFSAREHTIQEIR